MGHISCSFEKNCRLIAVWTIETKATIKSVKAGPSPDTVSKMSNVQALSSHLQINLTITLITKDYHQFTN